MPATAGRRSPCIKRAKLFVILRERRHEILDEEFQEELGGTIYRDSRLDQRLPWAGQATGGDKRGRQSAAVRVVENQPYPYLRVDEHPDPVIEPRRDFIAAASRSQSLGASWQ